jgi:hypothetical protein
MDRVYYKLDIHGIVYLVDPVTATAYTYDLSHPTEVGKVIWTDSKASPTLEFRADLAAMLAAKLTHAPAPE